MGHRCWMHVVIGMQEIQAAGGHMTEADLMFAQPLVEEVLRMQVCVCVYVWVCVCVCVCVCVNVCVCVCVCV